MGQCQSCGTPISDRATWCRRCGPAQRKKERKCIDCGVQLLSRGSAQRCKRCGYIARNARWTRPKCIDCGIELGRSKGKATSIHCRSCAQKARRFRSHCTECGKELSSNRSERCRECWIRLGSPKSPHIQRVCESCRKPIAETRTGLCRECFEASRPRHLCQQCGQSVSAASVRLCWRCESNRRATENGRRKLITQGYAKVYRPGHPRADHRGYVFEHIAVLEEVLDRPIERDEHVHHINGKKDDNRPENLVVMRGDDHAKHHHSMAVLELIPLLCEECRDKILQAIGASLPRV